MRGLTENQGGFSFVLLDNPGNKGPHKATVSHLSRRVVTNPRRARVGDNVELSRTHYFGGHAEPDVLWRLRDTVQAPLAASFQSVAHRLKEANKDIRKQAWRVRPVLPNDIQDDMNRQACMRCHAGPLPPYRARRLCVSSIVLQRVLRLPFEIDVAWVPHEQCVWRYLPRDVLIASCYRVGCRFGDSVPLRVAQAMSADFRDIAGGFRSAFDERFAQQFGLGDHSRATLVQRRMAKAALSDTLGSLTFNYGASPAGQQHNTRHPMPAHTAAVPGSVMLAQGTPQRPAMFGQPHAMYGCRCCWWVTGHACVTSTRSPQICGHHVTDRTTAGVARGPAPACHSQVERLPG